MGKNYLDIEGLSIKKNEHAGRYEVRDKDRNLIFRFSLNFTEPQIRKIFALVNKAYVKGCLNGCSKQYDEGYGSGYTNGYAKGHDKGKSIGKDEGRKEAGLKCVLFFVISVLGSLLVCNGIFFVCYLLGVFN